MYLSETKPVFQKGYLLVYLIVFRYLQITVSHMQTIGHYCASIAWSDLPSLDWFILYWFKRQFTGNSIFDEKNSAFLQIFSEKSLLFI